MEAFYAVLPVFLLIAVGAAVHMTDVLPENTGAAMGLYVLKLALPVLMLHILSGASRLDLAHGGFWLGVIGAQMLCYLLGYAVDRLFSRRGTGPAIISGLACSASNTAFVGLPIVAGLLPGNHEAMVVAGLAALTPNVVVIMAQIRMDCLAGSAAWGDGRGRIWKLLRLFLLGNPLLLATLAGLALACSGLGLWQPLDHAAALIGSTAAPCMLLALGFDLRQKLVLALRRNGGHTVIRQAWLLLCKLGIHPLICWGIMHLAGRGRAHVRHRHGPGGLGAGRGLQRRARRGGPDRRTEQCRQHGQPDAVHLSAAGGGLSVGKRIRKRRCEIAVCTAESTSADGADKEAPGRLSRPARRRHLPAGRGRAARRSSPAVRPRCRPRSWDGRTGPRAGW